MKINFDSAAGRRTIEVESLTILPNAIVSGDEVLARLAISGTPGLPHLELRDEDDTPVVLTAVE